MGSCACTCSLDRYDHQDDEGDGHDHEDEEADYHEGDEGLVEGNEEGPRQDGEESERKAPGFRHEEIGEGNFRAEEVVRRSCIGVRREDCASHGGYEEDLGLHQEERVEQRPDHKTRLGVEGNFPCRLFGYAQDGRLCQQAPVLRPWGEPRPFSRRVPTSRRALESRGRKSRARVLLEWLLLFDTSSCLFFRTSVGALSM